MRFVPSSTLGLATAWALLSVPSVVAEEPNSNSGELLKGCRVEPTDDILALVSQLREQESDGSFDKVQADEPIKIDTYLHVLAKDQKEMDLITDEGLKAQMDVLNQNYAPYGISFNQSGITREVNMFASHTYNYPSAITTTQYHKGGYDSLNVYLMSSLDGAGEPETLGYARFPEEVTEDSPKFTYDGVAILSSTIPGGSLDIHNVGTILVHEVGHWLGLFHTFQGRCEGGDLVDDTPAQRSPSGGSCDESLDTCPNQPGKDPVHNFMNYAPKTCMNQFTDGQSTRIHNMWNKFRAPK